MRILIADDDKDMRLLLSKTLKNWGYEVITVSNGTESWKILQSDQISFVISDWMMPKMAGPELCRRIRAVNFPSYVYLILLTAKEDKKELIEGMKAGADDFVVKPFDRGELRVRIKAGERILHLERNLEIRNKQLSESNEKLRKAYSVMSNDLDAAAKIQKDLLPETALKNINGFHFDWLFCPSSFVAGDIFNVFNLDERYTGFYLLDVAGHGIPSAMLSVTLSKVLSPSPAQSTPLKYFVPDDPPHYEATPPAMVIRELNKRFLNEGDAMQYFTIVYGIVDTRNGQVRIARAGHPFPVYLTKEGNTFFIRAEGIPVGMLPDVDYEEKEFYLQKGDRLFLYSDGITECTNKELEMFSESRLIKLLEKCQGLPMIKMIKKLEQTLQHWRGNSEFDDDITFLGIERV